MRRGGQADPWAAEKLTRSEAQRSYNNLVQYQLRPMLLQRGFDDEARVAVLKRIIREASRIKYEAGVVAGGGIREEVVDLLTPYLKIDSGAGEEFRDFIKRTIRAFGASIGSDE
jgi:hypothetical protein